MAGRQADTAVSEGMAGRQADTAVSACPAAQRQIRETMILFFFSFFSSQLCLVFIHHRNYSKSLKRLSLIFM
jgi:hypothetical protein